MRVMAVPKGERVELGYAILDFLTDSRGQVHFNVRILVIAPTTEEEYVEDLRNNGSSEEEIEVRCSQFKYFEFYRISID